MYELAAIIMIASLFMGAGCSADIHTPVALSTTPNPSITPQMITLTLPVMRSTSTIVSASAAPTETPIHHPSNTAMSTQVVERPFEIGYSVQGRPLLAYRIGNGSIVRLLVGGIHGGYEWNTTTLLDQFILYLTESPDIIPPQITLYIIPLANPDGAAMGTDRVFGRLNANSVDLNRNWDYQWQSTATHGTNVVSAGSAPFSEPETIALRDFILDHKVQAAIFYHSAMSEVYSGAGRDTSKTEELALLMAQNTDYRYAPEGIPGQITTGDAIDWLTTQGITAVEVELSSHTELDWDQNLAALLAFLKWDLDF